MPEQFLTWEAVKNFANSAFTTSLLGALAGAFGGAYAAQLIAKRTKRRDDLLAEIRNVNAAISVAFSIVNSLLALKKQHVRSLLERHTEEEAKLREYKLKRDAGFIQGDAQHRFQADFQTLEPVSLPVAQLIELVLTKLSTAGRPLNLVISLTGTVDRLNALIAKRNTLISEFRASTFPEGANLVCMYFGLSYGDGHLNQEYPDAVRGIASYLDDLIFFSHLLCNDLREHGEILVKRFKSEVGGSAPRISQVRFDTPEAKDLIPPDANYASLLGAFLKRPEEEKVRWWKR
ncbi:MAG: hypothetical protein C4516_02780 [Oxalobacter sp.]|nr:MAG: hypothetical protein C4516_02780 [Oxalobacter sp.]